MIEIFMILLGVAVGVLIAWIFVLADLRRAIAHLQMNNAGYRGELNVLKQELQRLELRFLAMQDRVYCGDICQFHPEKELIEDDTCPKCGLEL